jgi:hypothetical protein
MLMGSPQFVIARTEVALCTRHVFYTLFYAFQPKLFPSAIASSLTAQCVIVPFLLNFQHAPSICIVGGGTESYFSCEDFMFFMA